MDLAVVLGRRRLEAIVEDDVERRTSTGGRDTSFEERPEVTVLLPGQDHIIEVIRARGRVGTYHHLEPAGGRGDARDRMLGSRCGEEEALDHHRRHLRIDAERAYRWIGSPWVLVPPAAAIPLQCTREGGVDLGPPGGLYFLWHAYELPVEAD